MAESQEHIYLVNLLYKKICQLVPSCETCLIEKDLPTNRQIGGRVQGYIPDIYYWQLDLFIIGEAKTLMDFDSKHSQSQLRAYIDECNKFQGISILVIAIPLRLKSTVLNYFRRIKRKEKITISRIIVIDELGSEFEV